MAATDSSVAESQSTARIVSVPPDGLASLGEGAAELLAAGLELGAAELEAASSVPPEQATRSRAGAVSRARAARPGEDVRVIRGGYVALTRESRHRDLPVTGFPVSSQPRPWRRAGIRSHTRDMTRTARRLTTLAVAFVALFAVGAVPAQASESALRERTHARIAAVVSDAVNSGIYSVAQDNYVTSALLPVYVDPKDLSAKVEERNIEAFWDIVADGAGSTVGSVQARIANGSTLLRVTGDSSGDVQERLYRWLSRPVVEAQFDGKISAAESATLREDIARSVDRLMRQPGGSDGKVAVSPRRI